MKKKELVKDIFAFAVLLVRLERDDILENRKLFVEMLNESTDSEGNHSFRTTTGKEFTYSQFDMFMKRLPKSLVDEVLDEFSDSIDVLNSAFQRSECAICCCT